MQDQGTYHTYIQRDFVCDRDQVCHESEKERRSGQLGEDSLDQDSLARANEHPELFSRCDTSLDGGETPEEVRCILTIFCQDACTKHAAPLVLINFRMQFVSHFGVVTDSIR